MKIIINLTLIFILLLLLVFSHQYSVNGKWKTLHGSQPILAAHQGERYLMPEHSLGSYEFSALAKAEYIEPDLVLTKDHVLVCFHDITLKSATDVEDHPEFAHLQTDFIGKIGNETYNIRDNWLVANFTLEELKTLRIKQRNVGVRPQYFNSLFAIPTFEEFLTLIQDMNRKLNTTLGIIPEIKHPRYHNFGKENEYLMEDLTLDTLQRYGYAVEKGLLEGTKNVGHLIIQSFDRVTISYLRRNSDAELMMLVHPEVDLLTYKSLAWIASLAHYFSPNKEFLYTGVEAEIAFRNWTYDKDYIDFLGGFIPTDKFVDFSHSLGLKIGVWTINDSREPGGRGCASPTGCDPEDKEGEMFYFFDLGVDAMFVENIGESREIRAKYACQYANDIK